MIKQKERLIQELRIMNIKDENVLSAIENVKREFFIPRNYRKDAYRNIALPTYHEQTISQPYTVAFMLELLEIEKDHKILEIGAGSGYNAAVMSKLSGKKGKIFSVEINRELVKFAKKNLEKTGIENVKIIHGDGYHGYKKEAPYDRIIVTAATPKIPEQLIKQLKSNGIMVIPLSESYNEIMTKKQW